MSEQPNDPKIIVDEDWKDRVRAEREAARYGHHAAPEPQPGQKPPTASPLDFFAVLVSSLATQAMIALGQLPDPTQGHAVVRPELAKHAIDTLAMLEQKTQGNLTTDETRMLDDVLHQLRLLFLAVYKAPQDVPTGVPPERIKPERDASEEGDGA